MVIDDTKIRKKLSKDKNSLVFDNSIYPIENQDRINFQTALNLTI